MTRNADAMAYARDGTQPKYDIVIEVGDEATNIQDEQDKENNKTISYQQAANASPRAQATRPKQERTAGGASERRNVGRSIKNIPPSTLAHDKSTIMTVVGVRQLRRPPSSPASGRRPHALWCRSRRCVSPTWQNSRRGARPDRAPSEASQ